MMGFIIEQGVAILISFLVSAVFHEVLYYVLLCHATFSNSGHFLGSCFRYRRNAYMLTPIMSVPQIPLVFLTRYLQDKFKNIMVCCA
ncbi:hypothetical protein HU200_013412 [Digitaria exilis]|uniref:Uncharacterized protein n=1 Tax=Digitaria exilis TaxID=1010633 RepID=A0A835FE93_9POAL|nr:hypothetical protein HU200_013412 [Digitaria exilis]